jgi:nucleoside 2-deoxyribosyltransferase
MSKTLYLCGPINGCTDAECKDWRDLVKSKLWWGPTLDPMRRDYRGREDECVREIVELDKIDIMRSDAILVNYPQPSTGTDMEIIYAWERGKPVVAVVPEGARISPWLRYHTHKIVNTFEEGVLAANEFAVR